MFSMVISEPSRQQRRHHGKGGGGRIARNVDLLGRQFVLAFDGDVAGPSISTIVSFAPKAFSMRSV